MCAYQLVTRTPFTGRKNQWGTHNQTAIALRVKFPDYDTFACVAFVCTGTKNLLDSPFWAVVSLLVPWFITRHHPPSYDGIYCWPFSPNSGHIKTLVIEVLYTNFLIHHKEQVMTLWPKLWSSSNLNNRGLSPSHIVPSVGGTERVRKGAWACSNVTPSPQQTRTQNMLSPRQSFPGASDDSLEGNGDRVRKRWVHSLLTFSGDKTSFVDQNGRSVELQRISNPTKIVHVT